MPPPLLIVDDSIEDRASYRRYPTKDPNSALQIFEADTGIEGWKLANTAHGRLGEDATFSIAFSNNPVSQEGLIE